MKRKLLVLMFLVAIVVGLNAEYPTAFQPGEKIVQGGLGFGMMGVYGDVVIPPISFSVDIAKELGVKNLRWVPSASFPCHEPLIKYLEDGTIHHIEGSMNGPLGRFASVGKMKGLGVLRSHGGRYQAIQDGEVHIDIAVFANFPEIHIQFSH